MTSLTGRRGRLAPTPTGYLHVGHAQTFAVAARRAGKAGLVLRIEDLDGPRCRPEFTAAAIEDLRWLGLDWTEGPDRGGPHAPYVQSERATWYLEIWRRLEAAGAIYPSPHSRRDVEQAASAPHGETRAGEVRAGEVRAGEVRAGEVRAVFDASHIGQATSLPPRVDSGTTSNAKLASNIIKTSPLQTPSPTTQPVAAGLQPAESAPDSATGEPRPAAEPVFPPTLRPRHWARAAAPGNTPWRFRVPDGRVIEFHDALCGSIRLTAGVDFGDFVVWRRDDLAAYELAVVADDHAMQIEEVVRGADLLVSTARQLLLYEALGWQPPSFAHTPLVCDASGQRLAKRTGGLAIRELRAAGWSAAAVLEFDGVPRH